MGAKWIKLDVDLFDNRKIKYLRGLPEGDLLALSWVMLLTLAGKCNDGGRIYLTEDVPYTVQALAGELGVAEKFMRRALKLFVKLGMVTLEDFIQVSGWEEHQNVEGMEKIREQTRKRVAKHRQTDSDEAVSDDDACNVTCNVTVTQCNAPDKEREIEEEKKVKKKSERFAPPTQEQVKCFCQENGYTVDAEHFVSYYQANGWKVGRNPMRDWKAAVRTWQRRDSEPKTDNRLLPCDANNYGYVISPIEDPFETAMREKGYV